MSATAPRRPLPAAPAAALVACLLLAAATRLPGLAAQGLSVAEQVGFVESQGFSTRAVLPAERRIESAALPRRSGLVEIARVASVPPLHAASLALWTRDPDLDSRGHSLGNPALHRGVLD